MIFSDLSTLYSILQFIDIEKPSVRIFQRPFTLRQTVVFLLVLELGLPFLVDHFR